MTHPKVDEAKEKMHKAVVHLQDEFGAIRTGRATPALVEKLKVDYYGIRGAAAAARRLLGARAARARRSRRTTRAR